MLDLLLSAVTSEAILIFDQQGYILRSNPLSEKMFGYKENEMMGLPLSALVPEKFKESHTASFRNFIHKSNGLHMSKFRPLLGKRKDGTEFMVEISIGKGMLDSQTMLMAVLREPCNQEIFEGRNRVTSELPQ